MLKTISKLLKYLNRIFFCLALFFSFSASGQNKFVASSMRVGIDATAIGQSVFDPSLNFFEINSDMTFKKYIFSFDFGAMNYNRGFKSEARNADYFNQGQYFRLGADFNLIPVDVDNNAIFIGLRYARSFFNEKLDFRISDPVYGELDQKLNNSGMTAGWMEVVAGMKVKVVKNIFCGYTFRYKFQRRRSSFQDFIPHEIPGFGRERSKNVVGFNYHIFYQIPFKEKAAKIVTAP